MKQSRLCQQCGSEYVDYPDRRPKFCSMNCAWKNDDRKKAISVSKTKDRGTAKCGKCGIIFKLKTNGGVKFCSNNCASSAIGSATMNKNRRPKPLTKFIAKQCEACQKEFHSWVSNERKYCSNACASTVTPIQSAKTHHANGFYKSQKMYSRGKASWVEIGGKKFYARSQWEANYGLYLNFIKVNGIISDWEHEPETFWFNGIRRGVCSYLPDFRITNLDGSIEFHEVKGWMDDKSKTKIRRMAKYHPSVKLIVRGKEWFKANKALRAIVPGWLKPRL